MWVPVAGLPPRLTLSVFSGVGRFCVLTCGAARWRDVLARTGRGYSDFQPQLLPSQGFGESPSWVSKCRLESRRYITSPRLAETVGQILREEHEACQLFLECNPGESIVGCIFLDVHHFCKYLLTTMGCFIRHGPFKQRIWFILIMTQ